MALVDVLSMSNEEMRLSHSWIQWVFPLPTESKMVPGSPVATEQDIWALRTESRIRLGTETSAGRFMWYLCSEPWCTPGNHDLFRVTRVIRSLRISDHRAAAAMLYHYALSHATKARWGNAAPEKVITHWTVAYFEPYSPFWGKES